MSSSLTWLDYSDRERRQVLDMIDLFSERDTRDELGIGSIRDGFADRFFPGTSTIQTRVRYFLLIPWIYRDVERGSGGRAGAGERARKAELSLIDALVASDDSEGTIGQQARRSLKRLPSDVYWQPMARWGIRLFPGSREQYHRRIQSIDSLASSAVRTDDGEPIDGATRSPAWDPSLPEPPPEFPGEASLRLTAGDSEYLTERILSTAPDTLLAWLVREGHPTEPVTFAWDHPQVAELPDDMGEELHHGHLFSESMQGSALLYNLLLAERAQDEARVDEYSARLAEWAGRLRLREAALARWSRERFWEIVGRLPARVPPPTRDFVDRWLDIAMVDPELVNSDERTRRLVADREVAVKGGQARLKNDRALELWGGAAGVAQLDFRWGVAQRHVRDILAAPLRAGTSAAGHRA